MNKLYIFGDSFSCKFGDVSKDYVKWKGYEPKTMGDLISEKLNLIQINNAYGGLDNYSIFYSVYEKLDVIDKNDIILIGWSIVDRFRLVNTSGDWLSILPNLEYNIENNGLRKITDVSQTSINEILVNRFSNRKKYIEELNILIDVINKILKNNIVVHWSWVNYTDLKLTIPYFDYKTMYSETNGEVPDYHANEESAIIYSENIINAINKIKNKNEINNEKISFIIINKKYGE